MIPNMQILFAFCYSTPELTLGSALHVDFSRPRSKSNKLKQYIHFTAPDDVFKLQNPNLALKQGNQVK